MCTNRSNRFMRSYVLREFSSVRWKMMKEYLGVSKDPAWGCARNPQEIFKETQASKLGDAPVHPLLHQQSSVRPSLHYIFSTSCVMCWSWSVFALSLVLVLFCLLVITMSEPNMLDWERYTLHLKLEYLIGFSCLFFAVSCSLSFLS